MKVTAIIPNYNHFAYLQQRIESVIQQTYPHLEIIILDDNSTDNSKSIIETYRTHSRISNIIYNKENSGSTFRQWKKGIAAATGDWIWIAESDDWCEPCFLQTLMNGVLNDDATVLAFSQSYIIQNDKSVRGISHYPVLEETINGDAFLKKHLLKGNIIFNASMAIFKKAACLKIEYPFEQLRFCGDWIFWIEIALQGKVFACGKALNYFRKHDTDVTGKSYFDGTFYEENISIADYLVKKNIRSKEESTDYLIALYHQLNYDNKINKKLKPIIKKLIAEKMEISKNVATKKWLFKYWKANTILQMKEVYARLR